MRREMVTFAGIVMLAAIVRAIFILQMDAPTVDPWRHLMLIENLKAGRDFTLFGGQPYIWYAPPWYVLAAAASSVVSSHVLAAILSVLTVAGFYFYLRNVLPGQNRAWEIGAILMACCGPLVKFTCQPGSESFALFMMILALVSAAAGGGPSRAFLGGLLFGLCLVTKINFCFAIFLFIPLLQNTPRRASFAAGLVLPLYLMWRRNSLIIESHPFLFTWDGLATDRDLYNFLSTLIPQLHPDVTAAVAELHKMMRGSPESITKWELPVFLVLGGIALLASRRRHLILAGMFTILGIVFIGGPSFSSAVRHYLGCFPIFFAAFAYLVPRLEAVQRPRPGVLPGYLVAAVAALFSSHLMPPRPLNVDMFAPPEQLLTGERYMVNSNCYHPESVIYRFPQKNFIGMPAGPERFEEFCRAHPDYRTILWRHIGIVQPELEAHLRSDPRYEWGESANNRFGITYSIIHIRT